MRSGAYKHPPKYDEIIVSDTCPTWYCVRLSLQFLVLLWKIMFQVTIWAWTNHIDLSILHQLGARVPDTYHCTAPRAYSVLRAYKQFKIMCKLPLELLKIGMIITVHGPRTLRCVFNSCDAWRIIIPFYNNSAIYTVISLNRPKPPFPLRCNFTRYIFTFSIILVTNFPHLITVVVHDFPTMSLSNTKWLIRGRWNKKLLGAGDF